jgi:hypothetical protein
MMEYGDYTGEEGLYYWMAGRFTISEMSVERGIAGSTPVSVWICRCGFRHVSAYQPRRHLIEHMGECPRTQSEVTERLLEEL